MMSSASSLFASPATVGPGGMAAATSWPATLFAGAAPGASGLTGTATLPGVVVAAGFAGLTGPPAGGTRRAGLGGGAGKAGNSSAPASVLVFAVRTARPGTTTGLVGKAGGATTWA